MTLVLGIETSCDETAAAVIAQGREIRSNVVASQIDLHRQYGGVFPEMASRQHVIAIVPVIEQAMRDAQARWTDLDAIAVTYGPGLAGSLLVGINMAKGLAYGRELALIGVNHLEAHIATNWLDVARAQSAPKGQAPPELAFPLLCLIVSGGHTELILMSGYGEYQRLGGTIDDAAGEAFDKVARLLGLAYPGGPAIQRASEGGNPTAFPFPRARLDNAYDFSFSGLKTAVLRTVQQYEPDLERPADKVPDAEGEGKTTIPAHIVSHMAASFQRAVVDALVEKTVQAAAEFGVRGVLMAGGVAANRVLRQSMRVALRIPLHLPPVALATDNATGVGVVGHWALHRGHTDSWDLDAVPNLKLAY
ncbi:MAG: tRNA (adenosine(37)-N6)-threonylcarbamoyltransferase complex transferase subunit TsaD [Anaerolineae bacterium]|nr:tRNA (adenosine(37)-N6)-threonylcarbamoyltransferase complex transferase subunit TsaD [Anaerolineae bacterium]